MKQHALVIGGGIAGLLAAHALSKQFERISVLERGHYPGLQDHGSPAMRPGIPQSRCPHLLMAAGIAAIDELLPGWKEPLQSLGAVPFDASADVEVRLSAGYLPRSPSGISLYACSRSLLEHVLRSRITPDTGITLYPGHRIMQLEHDRSANSVTGVRLSRPGSDSGELIDADLVVDASGSASKLPRWLAQLCDDTGPDEVEVDHQASFAGSLDFSVSETCLSPGRRQVSCWYHIDPEDAPDWHCLAIAPDPCNDYRAAMMLRAEHDRWGLVVVDPTQESLAESHEELWELLVRFGDDKLCRVLEHARPISPVYRLRPSLNRWRHYERMENWPAGLCALGDSVCSLDPYSGLGMSVAARAALLLKKEAVGSVDGCPDSRHFQLALAEQNRAAWEQATGCDTQGQALGENSLFLRQSYAAAPGSQAMAHAILRVQHLLSPRDSLMSAELA